jgi:hypothetical protein
MERTFHSHAWYDSDNDDDESLGCCCATCRHSCGLDKSASRGSIRKTSQRAVGLTDDALITNRNRRFDGYFQKDSSLIAAKLI